MNFLRPKKLLKASKSFICNVFAPIQCFLIRSMGPHFKWPLPCAETYCRSRLLAGCPWCPSIHQGFPGFSTKFQHLRGFTPELWDDGDVGGPYLWICQYPTAISSADVLDVNVIFSPEFNLCWNFGCNMIFVK